jgi:uncharacterized protein (DUF1800 family)
MDMNAAIAATRFGLGQRPDTAAPADPRRWLHDQLTSPDPTPLAGKLSTADTLRMAYQVQVQERADKDNGTPKDARPPNAVGLQLREEIHDLYANALVTPAPFRERLVWFWANHFTVAARNRVVNACAGAYIRDAIRPHVTGHFRDMLLAVMRHPAMLTYLDQARSAGPDSPYGERKHLGLNENLARECLELHTVTPASGYTQADVTAFARVLTGWSFEWKEEPVGFRFRARIHEPGQQTVMGQQWPGGEAGGIALLTWLADHPYTHRHLAEKLVRHFVADDPPPAAVLAVEAVLRDTGGNLGAASAALIDLPGAWSPLTKLRTPQDYVIACLRGLGMQPEAVPNMAYLAAGLGQGMFQAPFPIGWPDRAADWAGPEALLQRVDFAYGLAGRVPTIDPVEHANVILGPLLGADTLSAMKGAGSRRDAMTLLIASPEFQRR